MSVLDTTKQIFLSEKINDSDRRSIVRSYYTSCLKKLSVEIDKETDKISEKFLNKYYDKHLGKSWNKLAEKYKLRQHNIYLFYEKSLIKEKQCIVVHIGDGLTGFEKDGKVGIITYPMNGEYANTTYFITEDNAEYMMQCRLVELKSKSIRLFCLSDGSADLYYNSVFGLRNTNSLVYCFKEIEECENQTERLGCLERLLGYISPRFTADDCSISVMSL